MAGWKKIITSGSDAVLNSGSFADLTVKTLHVTGSGTLTTDEFAITNKGSAIGINSGGTGLKASDLTAGQFLAANSTGTDWVAANTSSIDIRTLTSNTAFGLSLVTSSQADHVRDHIGLGTIATQNLTSTDLTGDSSLITSGDIKTDGTVIFSGSSALTQNQITGSFTGSFYGDGTNLTGVASTISMSADSGTAGGEEASLKDEIITFKGGDGMTSEVSSSTSGSIKSTFIIHDVDATQTAITSIKNDGLVVGGNSQNNVIDFATDDEIKLQLDSADKLVVSASGIGVTGNISATGTIKSVGAITTDAGLTAKGNVSLGDAASDTTTISGEATVGTAGTTAGQGGINVQGTITDGQYSAADGSTRYIGLHVENDVSASGFVGEFWEISSSILVTSESTTFGNSTDDSHTFIGDIVTATTGSDNAFTEAAGLLKPDLAYLSASHHSNASLGYSGSTEMRIDFRSAFGGVTGSFAGDGRNLDLSANTTIGSEIFKTITTGNASADVVADTNSDTLNLTSGSGTAGGIDITTDAATDTITWTLKEVPNEVLANDSVEITAGGGLKNGGAVSLGSSVTLNVDVSDFIDSTNPGIEENGVSEKIRLAAQGTGISGGAGSLLSITPEQTAITGINNANFTTLGVSASALDDYSYLDFATQRQIKFTISGSTADSLTDELVVKTGGVDVANDLTLASGADLVMNATTIDETDIAKIDGITNGTVTANKAIVVDPSRNVGSTTVNGVNNLYASGLVQVAGNITGSGNLNIGADGAKFTVVGTSGNTAVGGTLTTTGNATFNGNIVGDSTSAGSGTTISGIDSIETKGNVTVGGNLNVIGSTTRTEIQSQELNIADNIIRIGSGSSTSEHTVDSGIAFERHNTAGDADANNLENKYAMFFYDETANRFAMGHADADTGVTGGVSGGSSLIAAPAYVMTVKQTGDNVVPTNAPSESIDNPTDFGADGVAATQVGQVKINNNGDIWIYS